MKVRVDLTLDVSEEQRKQIAMSLGRKEVDREGIKEFLWKHGANWEYVLDPSLRALSAVPDLPDEDDFDDLLGPPPAKELLDMDIL